MPYKLQARMASLAAVVLGMTFVAACGSPQPTDAESDNLAQPTAPKPVLPIVTPPFDRARLLLAVARAASAHSAGVADVDAQRGLDGKQIEVRLRFGCEGQGPGGGDHGWSVDPDGRTLRLRAVPNLSLEDELVRNLGAGSVEAAEGFWLPRPWLFDATCPADSPEAGTAPDSATQASPDVSDGRELGDRKPSMPAAAAQRIGIAQFFTPDDSRTGRRMNRPFEAVKLLKEGEGAGLRGFNLVLSGRLRARPDGRVILCAGAGRNRPPDCVVSATLDRVWIERPEDKAVMAEWSI